MKLIINDRKIENPFAIIAMAIFVLSLVGGVVALVLFVLLPLLGIFISGLLALILVILTPIILWIIVPVLFLSIIALVFGKIS